MIVSLTEEQTVMARIESPQGTVTVPERAHFEPKHGFFRSGERTKWVLSAMSKATFQFHGTSGTAASIDHNWLNYSTPSPSINDAFDAFAAFHRFIRTVLARDIADLVRVLQFTPPYAWLSFHAD